MIQSSREAHLQELMLRELPVARFMAVRVEARDERGLTLRSPEAPNKNAHGTMFGGSIGALALLAGWGFVRLQLEEEKVHAEVVVQRSELDYRTPVLGEATALARAPTADEWDRFRKLLTRRGKARIKLTVEVTGAGSSQPNVVMEGWFVALTQ